MRLTVLCCVVILFSFFISRTCSAQVAGTVPQMVDSAVSTLNKCLTAASALLLNSVKERDDWQIVTGPAIKGLQYPIDVVYIKPYPSWERDRYTADSSYFKNCDWMVLPDKRKVVNTVSREPLVFIKRFTTTVPARIQLLVKMLYDNMAYLYIDSIRVPLNHRNPDINRFIKEVSPELSSFVSIPSTFNTGYNASFYAGDLKKHVLPAGEHTIKIELFNNANEMGCIIKGMLVTAAGEDIFCGEPIDDLEKGKEDILVFKDEKAFPGNKTADFLYNQFMQSVKHQYWINNLLSDTLDIIGTDTIQVRKGVKINIAPQYVTLFRNGRTDTTVVNGRLWKNAPSNAPKKEWSKAIVFDAKVAGTYSLEISCESPVNDTGKNQKRMHHYSRIIRVK